MKNCYFCHHPLSAEWCVRLKFEEMDSQGQVYHPLEWAHKDCLLAAATLYRSNVWGQTAKAPLVRSAK